jgi:hypothetical protein
MLKTPLIFLLLIFHLSSKGQNQRKDFKVFDALLFKDTPDLSKYGFKKLNLIYEDGVISTDYHVKDTRAMTRRFIDQEKVINQAKKSRISSQIPTCLDVEHWPVSDPKYQKYAIAQYVNLIKEYRKNDRKSLVSVFHYGAVSREIYDASNVIYPCYYTHDENPNVWIGMVNNSIVKIRKFGNKKPVYAFIWPQNNPQPNKPGFGYKFIDRKVWRMQLERLYELCDGVVIWSHYQDENGKTVYFDKNMPWFQETLDFMADHNIK